MDSIEITGKMCEVLEFLDSSTFFNLQKTRGILRFPEILDISGKWNCVLKFPEFPKKIEIVRLDFWRRIRDSRNSPEISGKYWDFGARRSFWHFQDLARLLQGLTTPGNSRKILKFRREAVFCTSRTLQGFCKDSRVQVPDNDLRVWWSFPKDFR